MSNFNYRNDKIDKFKRSNVKTRSHSLDSAKLSSQLNWFKKVFNCF